MMVHCGNACSMAKVGTNGEVYAVLMEGNVKEAEEAAVPLRAGRKSGRPDGPCRRLPNCLGWSLLLTVTATCITVLAFQLWATWHLQQKVLTLQAQVDSISALDLEELRSQLRDLYDLRDLTSSDRDADIETAGLRGHPTSADEDQVLICIFRKIAIVTRPAGDPQTCSRSLNGCCNSVSFCSMNSISGSID